jgi:hypothetical protein
LRFIFDLKFIFKSNFFKMASVRVHFSPGFPLGGFPAEQFARGGGKRQLEERRGCSSGQRNKMRLLMLVGGGCSGGIRNSAEKGISWRGNCQVFAPAVFEIRRAPQETVFLLRRYSIHAEQHVGVMSGAFFYQYCLTDDRVPKTFELTLNKSASPSAPALGVLFPAE